MMKDGNDMLRMTVRKATHVVPATLAWYLLMTRDVLSDEYVWIVKCCQAAQAETADIKCHLHIWLLSHVDKMLSKCSTNFEWQRHDSPKLLIACPKHKKITSLNSRLMWLFSNTNYIGANWKKIPWDKLEGKLFSKIQSITWLARNVVCKAVISRIDSS